MPRYKLLLEYEGTRYRGWQYQRGERTIQGECLQAARDLFKTGEVECYGAGRTDAGVHALGQVAHLDARTSLSPDRIRMGLNDRLPHDINILHVAPASANFHARHDAVARSYVYLISRRRSAFGKRYLWWVKDYLDLPAMQRAAAGLTGLQDFRSFTPEKNRDQESTQVKVERLELTEQGDLILVHIIGSHFLWKMVRRIVGILVEVGRGQLQESAVENLITSPSNDPAAFTAPPMGLYLERVYYAGETWEKPVLVSLF